MLVNIFFLIKSSFFFFFFFFREKVECLDALHVLTTAIYVMRRLPPNLSPSSCDPAEGRPPLPMVFMFLPLVLGGWRVVGGGPSPTERRDGDRNRGWSDATETERHLLLISMGKFPRSRRLAWSLPPPHPPISPALHPTQPRQTEPAGSSSAHQP